VGKAEAPPVDTGTVSTFTGVPKEMLDNRVVKIFKPPPTVQNATQNTHVWKMQWEDERTERWANPLMGWTSTRDPLSNTHMTLEFGTKEDAIRFAERNGWKYETTEPKPNLTLVSKGPKAYADNFKWQGPPGRKFPELYEPPPPPPPPPPSK
jgi:NADH dehydrogenase (ubiquinone) Fe-S protein 4